MMNDCNIECQIIKNKSKYSLLGNLSNCSIHERFTVVIIEFHHTGPAKFIGADSVTEILEGNFFSPKKNLRRKKIVDSAGTLLSQKVID